ncbi:ABA-inducible protein PHV A1-like [Phalaenopsis equestris]|uniref:ABA-inducible protein PHV A1-like n=1 Tax=Phalaenopsis equestris TaxID=78828 RepID=UPI0009E4524E|nr:ABA-inducible protein PHV A1-like [Phalaenopsis equestris]
MSTQDKPAYHADEAKVQTHDKTNNLLGKAYDTAAEAKDKTAKTAQAAKDHVVEGKDNVGSYLQHAGDKIKSAAQGTTEAVKNILGLGEQK